MPDRRRAIRFNLPIPVILEHGTGLTHDLSANGVYIETNQCFNSVGDLLIFSLVFEEPMNALIWELLCTGVIIHTESLESGDVGIAVKILEECSVRSFSSTDSPPPCLH
ncbi:MAG: PilZ domain-containing protein [Gammaproteobacteria bacterium]